MIIKNKLLAQYLAKKDAKIVEGRALSKEIEKLEKQALKFEEKERKITEKVECKETIAEAMTLAEKIDEDVKKLEELQNKVREEKLAAIPADLRKDHEALLEEKKKLEKQRGKIGMEIERIKEKLVPQLHKKVVPQLPSEFHDIETAKLNKDGDIEVTIFSHVEKYREQFLKRKKQQEMERKQG